MCGTSRDTCKLSVELATQLVLIAALLTRTRRHLAQPDRVTSELAAIDEALTEPIELARKLGMTVHADCE
ncbi:MAG TPA: hypothetical protein VGY54_16710 [Polyangiaceae bacterium]|jgi:hypothetical protein|nr:hypothetical protein [Polyangiaceae bacterium]